MNDAYGFFDELCRKYGVQTARVLRNTIDRLYVSMPLCTWVPKHETFIAHAGPPLLLNGRGASSEEIGKIQRKSFSRTAASKTTLGGAATAEEGTHILEALLWGDPDPLLAGLPEEITVHASHVDEVKDLPNGFRVLAVGSHYVAIPRRLNHGQTIAAWRRRIVVVLRRSRQRQFRPNRPLGLRRNRFR